MRDQEGEVKCFGLIVYMAPLRGKVGNSVLYYYQLELAWIR